MYELKHDLPLEPPDEDELGGPYCPVCGRLCETVWMDECGRVVGCDMCLTSYDAGEVSDCWPEPEPDEEE